MTAETFDAWDAGELRNVQRSESQRDELSRELVAAICVQDPSSPGAVPPEVGQLGVEERVAIEVVVFRDAPAVPQYFGTVGVLLGGHVTGFFEEGHVDQRGAVALRARVAVPVPGSADIAGLVDDAHVVDPGFLQPCGCEQSREPGADHRDGDALVSGPSLLDRHVRIVDIVGERSGRMDVLVVAVRTQPLLALPAIPPAPSFPIHCQASQTPWSAPMPPSWLRP